MRLLAGALIAAGLATLATADAANAQTREQTQCSVWLVESSRFMHVPFGSFMPDRDFVPGSNEPEHNIPMVDLPVNVGVIKCGKELILYDSGWKQQEYHKMTGTEHWAPLPEQLKLLGFDANDVTKIVDRPRPLGPCRAADGLPERGALCPARGAAGHRVGAQLSEPEHQGGQHRSGRLHTARRPAATRR